LRRVGRILRLVLLQRDHRLVAVLSRDEQFGRVAVGALQQLVEHGRVRRAKRRGGLEVDRQPFGPARQLLYAQDAPERHFAGDVGQHFGHEHQLQQSEFTGGRIFPVNKHFQLRARCMRVYALYTYGRVDFKR